MLVGHIVVSIHSNLMRIISVRNGSVQSNFAILLMVHRADLEPILVASQKPRLLPTISRRTASHHRCLSEHTRATVGIRPLAGINGRKGNGILIILAQMKMSAEPPLDAAMLPHELDELATILFVGMVEPATTVDDVILLQNPQTGAIGRSVRKNEYLPPLVGGMVDQKVFEPCNLLVVDNHLVAGIGGIAKDGGAEADNVCGVMNFKYI